MAIAPAGQVRFTTTTLTADESSGGAMVTVERVHGSVGAFSIDYSVTGGTATAGAGANADLVRTYDVAPASRFNVSVNGLVPELTDEGFGASITSDLPIFVERAMYADAGGVVWAAGTVAAATRLP